MLKLFRKIRQSLLADGKNAKYIKYAIGEIVLVVIGILIAFNINNWNEGRNQKLQEKQLLLNLQGEFNDNLQDLDSISIRVDRVISSLEKVFDILEKINTAASTD